VYSEVLSNTLNAKNKKIIKKLKQFISDEKELEASKHGNNKEQITKRQRNN